MFGPNSRKAPYVAKAAGLWFTEACTKPPNFQSGRHWFIGTFWRESVTKCVGPQTSVHPLTKAFHGGAIPSDCPPPRHENARVNAFESL
jgi:hypothetical protein